MIDRRTKYADPGFRQAFAGVSTGFCRSIIFPLLGSGRIPKLPPDQRHGAIAQLGERYNGIVEVTGSIPVGSTN